MNLKQLKYGSIYLKVNDLEVSKTLTFKNVTFHHNNDEVVKIDLSEYKEVIEMLDLGRLSFLNGFLVLNDLNVQDTELLDLNLDLNDQRVIGIEVY